MMKRKRIVVMGFMGSMPIAGVVWQHIHYVVGLQRLGHDVYFIEDSARLPYNPETFEVTDEFDYAAKVLARLAREFDFKNRWAYCARYLPGTPTAGMSLKKIRQLYRDADAILNVCGTQEFNDDLLVSDRILYIESDPGVEQIKIDKGVKVDSRISAAASRAFHIRRKHRDERFSRAAAWIQMAAHTTTSGDRSLENGAFPFPRRRVHNCGELVHERFERHCLARKKISLEQVTRISPVRRRAERSGRNIRDGNQHRRIHGCAKNSSKTTGA